VAILVAASFDAADWAAWWPALCHALPGEQLVRAQGDVSADAIDVALVANPTPGSLRDLPRLGFIQSLWAGVDRLLLDPTVPAQVPLARMVDPAMNDAMAQTALWAVLSLHRGFFGYATQQHRALWQAQPWRRADEVGVAVLGLGQMGRRSALCLADQGYRVLGWSARPAQVDGVPTFAGTDALPAVLAQAQVVVNLLPLTAATRGLFDAAAFAQMPRGAALVNLARGAHVVEADLLTALASGQLGHAVLDVFEHEPLPAGHPFWSHPAVTVLPHVAAPTDPRSAALIAARNVQAWRAGAEPAHLVDRSRGY